VLDVLDAALDESLLLARRVVLGILAEVTVRARLGDRLDDARPVLALEPAQLGAQLFGALQRERLAPHVVTSRCRSWSRLTSTSWR